MESKGEGKYDDDDDDAKSGSTRDAKSESKEQEAEDDALLRHVFDWYYEDEGNDDWEDMDGMSWSLGPVTISYDDAAVKIAATVSAAALLAGVIY